MAHVAVWDADSGVNGEADCRMGDDEASAEFRLMQLYDMEYKLLTEEIFHDDSPSVREVTIKCTDRGVPMFTASKRLLVHIV